MSMEQGGSITPSELRDTSNEDELVESSIYSAQIHSSIQPFRQFLMLWSGPVKPYRWTNLSECMKIVAEYGYRGKRVESWMRRTLDRISSSATSEQLIDILNGYADLYKTIIYLIRINDDVPISHTDIHSCGGTSSEVEQHKRCRNIAFIMCNSDASLFAPLYATNSDGQPQTCFATDDERITDHIAHLFRNLNDDISQRSASGTDLGSDNNDATTNVEESPTTLPSSDDILCPPSTVQNDDEQATSEIRKDYIQCTSETAVQPNFQHSEGESMIDVTANSQNSLSNTALATEEVQKQSGYTKEFPSQTSHSRQEVDDTSPMETDDRRSASVEGLKERELISKNIMIRTKHPRTQRIHKHVSSSNNNVSDTSVCLCQSTTKPTSIIVPDIQTTSRSVQQYDPPNVTREPKRYRRVRMLTDLAKKDCPLVQAGEGKVQRMYPEIEVPGDGENYVCVRVVTEHRDPHPSQCVAPQNALVDLTLMKNNDERGCLQCPPDSFDPSTECVFSPVTVDERKKRRKIIKTHLFHWKQHGPTSKQIIEHENLRLCRLEFRLCIRLMAGQYEFVSQPSYTSVIETVDGDVTINSSKIEPKQLCELGGQQISIPLSVQCGKKDFRIECNGDELNMKNFTMERKKLLFTSPPKVAEIDELHLIIKRLVYVDDSSERKKNELYDGYLPYVPHDSHMHTCSQSVRPVADDQLIRMLLETNILQTHVDNIFN